MFDPETYDFNPKRAFPRIYTPLLAFAQMKQQVFQPQTGISAYLNPYAAGFCQELGISLQPQTGISTYLNAYAYKQCRYLSMKCNNPKRAFPRI